MLLILCLIISFPTFSYADETTKEEIFKKYGMDANGQIVEPYDVQQYIDEQRASQAPGWDMPLKYYDKDAGISFLVPAGWIEVPLSESRDILKAKFQTGDSEFPALLMYGNYDLWSELSDEEKKQIPRSQMNNDLFTEDDFGDLFGDIGADVTKVYFGEEPYYQVKTTLSKTINGVDVESDFYQVATIKNGWVFIFQFGGNHENYPYSDFRSLVASVDYGENEITKSNKAKITAITGGTENLFASLILTIAIYSLPIIIYRYAIRKTPVDKKKAKTITIVYAIIGFFAMSIILFLLDGHVASGGALFLWSFVNYRVLVSGKEVECDIISVTPEEETADIADEQIIPTFEPPLTTDVIPTETLSTTKEDPAPAVTISRHFCHKCGTEALDGGLYCHRCGTKIVIE